ncbi:MAG: hypothetical protein ACR2MP_20915 [Streptosporangiaceae bacterium]
MTDVLELIIGDHQRIRRLLEALDDAARYAACDERGSPEWTLAAVWARIDTLLTLHADVEQEICFLPIYRGRTDWLKDLGDATAVLNDIQDAVAETRLQKAGSPTWWRAADAVRRSTCAHILATEDGPLADFPARSSARLRQQLSRQWVAFAAARRRDTDPGEQELPAASPAWGMDLRSPGTLVEAPMRKPG